MYEINILPYNLRKRKKKIKLGNPTYAPFLLIGVLIFTFAMNMQMDKRITNVEENISTTMNEINKVQTELQKISSITQEAETLKQDIQKINNLINTNTSWALVLDEISVITPPEVTIINIEEISKNMIKIDAETTKLVYMSKMKETIQQNFNFANTEISEYTYEPKVVKFTIRAEWLNTGGVMK